MDPSPAKVLLLAGGLGTRLRPLTHTLPKVMVPVLGRPFLEHVLEGLALQGFDRFVLSVGFLADHVEAHFGDGRRWGYAIEYSREESPLGTGGAVRHALPLLEETFFVANGDTLLQVDLAAMLVLHRREKELVTAATVWVPDRGRYGALHIEAGRIVRFEEKGAGPGMINGGLYLMDARAMQGVPQGSLSGAFSLEREFLPAHLGHIVAFPTRGFFVDMGTHEALQTLDASLSAYRASRAK
jgi:mannose-1-phosphate guanylyltransferase